MSRKTILNLVVLSCSLLLLPAVGGCESDGGGATDTVTSDSSGGDTGSADTGAPADTATQADTETPADTATPADTDEIADSSPSDTMESQDTAPATPAGPTWADPVDAFMAKYCVACHKSGSKDFRNYDSVVAKKANIRCGVAPTTQPGCNGRPSARQFPVGNGPKPTTEERQMIVDWVDAGTPEGSL